jgi:cytochrome c
MPAFEWNKIIASVLTALIVAMVAGILGNELIHPRELEKAAYMPAGTEKTAATSTATSAAPAGPEPIGPLMAKADPKKGAQLTAVCKACHTFEKGGPNRVGPNLFGVFGSAMGEDRGGYAFSAAMEKKKGNKWTADNLNHWLWKPQSFIPGTKMTFAGEPKAQNRADIIAYLQSLK